MMVLPSHLFLRIASRVKVLAECMSLTL